MLYFPVSLPKTMRKTTMRKPAAQRLREVLTNLGAEKHIILHAVNEMYGTVKSPVDKTHTDPSWAALRAGLLYDRRMVRSNRQHWPTWIAPLYEEYVLIQTRILERIENASVHPLKGQVSPERAEGNAHPPTLAEYKAHIHNANRVRESEGRPLTGACGTHWQSWVPPHIRREFCDRVALAYIEQGVSKGRKFVPFTTVKMLARYKERLKSMRTSIETVRRISADVGRDRASTAYRALHLAAARMAEMALGKIEKEVSRSEVHPLDVVIPVNWQHLLTSQMRQRLRDAAKDPKGVSLDGLRDFHGAMPDDMNGPYAGDSDAQAKLAPLMPDDEAETDDYEDSEPCS